MDSEYKLTDGALETIMNGGSVLDPIVQVLGHKKIICSVKETERYRLVISDGKFKVNIAMFTLPVNNPFIDASALGQYSIIKLKRYVSNVIKTKENRDTRILLILELELVARGDVVNHVIGDPAFFTDNGFSCSQSSQNLVFSPVSSRRKKRERVNLLSQARIICPILSLNPFHNNWVIKARVVNKTNIRNWSNAKGEGKLFNVTLADQSGEIRCTAFRELVDQFFDAFEVDKVYFVSKCICKPINRQFCNLNHEYEMVITPFTVVEESSSDNESIPQSTYNFTPIDKIAVMEAGAFVDVIAICHRVSDLQMFIAKTSNRELKKREVFLVDESKIGISLVLWGLDAESFQFNDHTVVAIKSAKIQEFQGTKSITLVGGSQLRVNPELPETQKLKTWFDFEVNQTEFKNISARTGMGVEAPWLTFKEVQAEDESKKDAGFYFQTLGTIILIKLDRAVYKSCPSTDCRKKVVDMENGMYRCEKCNREYSNFVYRLLISMNLSDASSNQWVTVFSSEAEKILGKTAQAIGEAMENDQDSMAKLFEDAQFKQFVFKCRAKMDTFNDERRLRVVVANVGDVNYESHNAYLLRRIEKFREITNN